MTRRERLEFLLQNYREVEYGLQDANPRGSDDFVPQMCRVWRHPSYVELRRCLLLLQNSEPILWWNLAETYFRYDERRIGACPRCQREFKAENAWDEDKGTGGEAVLEKLAFCKHGGHSYKVVPKIVRRISKAVRPELVDDAVSYLDREFKGEPFIPDDLLVLAA